MDFSVVEVETLPDIAGARQVYGLAPDVSDKNVAKVIFHRFQRSGDQPRFLPAGLSLISAVSVVSFRDQCLSLSSWSREQTDEADLLKALARHQAKLSGELVAWNAERNLSQLFAVRAMVVGCATPPVTDVSLADLLGEPGGTEHDRTILASRLGIACESVTTDEDNWEQFLAAGFSPLAKRCLLNAIATARLWLLYCQATGRITSDDHNYLIDQFDSLPAEGRNSVSR